MAGWVRFELTTFRTRFRNGNRTPFFPAANPALPHDWCFEVVFDYGEHDAATPRPIEDVSRRCRPDPFSRFRSGFEVRTYRLCSRVLMFLHFPVAWLSSRTPRNWVR